MENYGRLCGRVMLLCFFLGIFHVPHMKAEKENVTYPIKNVNLGPIQGWRSAFYCLYNMTTIEHCKPWYTLNFTGNISVSQPELPDYCNPQGCLNHTLTVLQCLQDVKKDFWFQNSYNLSQIKTFIHNGCENQTGGLHVAKYVKSGAMKVHHKAYVSIISILVFIGIFSL